MRRNDGVTAATIGHPLIGRDEELRFLSAHLESVASQGRAILLHGEPGVGKSALQAAVVEQARSVGLAHRCGPRDARLACPKP